MRSSIGNSNRHRFGTRLNACWRAMRLPPLRPASVGVRSARSSIKLQSSNIGDRLAVTVYFAARLAPSKQDAEAGSYQIGDTKQPAAPSVPTFASERLQRMRGNNRDGRGAKVGGSSSARPPGQRLGRRARARGSSSSIVVASHTFEPIQITLDCTIVKVRRSAKTEQQCGVY